ncbi:hypothetical protein Tco_0903742 [Tanacetum coccineum]
MSGKSSPLKCLIIGINVWVKLPEGENIFTLLRFLMQVILLLMTAWRESHASHYDQVISKGKYPQYCSEQVCLERSVLGIKVIKNGNKVLKKTVGDVKQVYEPTSAEEKMDRKNDMKARRTLYRGNKESKKVQRILLKQQYENFTGLSSETMEKTFDRLQKLISQLEIQGEVIEQEDMNLKLLKSLPSEWKTHALNWRNKEEIETIDLDDLYNNLKIYEPEITGSSSTSQNPQNMVFVSSNNTNSTNNTNKADNTAYGVSSAHTQSNVVNSTSVDNLSGVVIYAFLSSQPNSPQLAQEDLEQLHPDDLEEMDLQWEMAMLTIRARRFIKRTRRNLDINGQRIGFDKVEGVSDSDG